MLSTERPIGPTVPHPMPALVFDLDGTLVDSVHDIAAALNRVLDACSRPALTTDAVAGMVGDGAAMLVARGFAATGGPPPDAEAAVTRFIEIYESAAAVRTRPFPEVVKTLSALLAADTPLAVCTNKPEVATRIVLDALGLSRFFPVVVGGDSCATRKPDGAPLRAALKRLGIGAGPAVMIGDSINDVGTARAAGIPVICLRYGYTRIPPDELGADLLLDRFSEVPAGAARLTARA